MKNFKTYLGFLAVFALLLTSCSKDEDEGVSSDSEKATLSFGAIVQDLATKSSTKQSDAGDLPACSDDTPAYVEIVLMQGDTEVVGTAADPYRVDLVANELFTEEDPELELVPGDYVLDHFAVYNADGELIWLAPREGGFLADWVEDPLPMDISLGAGVKKYVDVSVLCYDDRDVNEYGYQFFEIDMNRAFEFCFFANYCGPDGRHYPARYSVDVSIDGNVIYSGEVNTVGVNEDGDFYAEPICGPLPDLAEYADDEEYIDYTLTLLDWEENYGDIEPIVISGSLSRDEVEANFDGADNVFYEHVRFGCDPGQEVEDEDNDGVIDKDDECPGTMEGVEVNAIGCPVETDTDEDGIVDTEDNCPETANPDQLDTDEDGVGDACEDTVDCAIEAADSGCEVVYVSGSETWVEVTEPGEFPDPLFLNLSGNTATNYGSISAFLDSGDAVVQISTDAGFDLDDYLVEVSDANDGTVDLCMADANVPAPSGDNPDATVVLDGSLSYPIYLRIKANVCPE